MKKKYFVTYEQAKILKELGFKEPCLYFYTDLQTLASNCYCGDEVYVEDLEISRNEINHETIDAPTLIQAREWLLENKGLFVNADLPITTEPVPEDELVFFWYINKKDGFQPEFMEEDPISENIYKSWQEALSVGISKCLEYLLKEEKK